MVLISEPHIRSVSNPMQLLSCVFALSSILFLPIVAAESIDVVLLFNLAKNDTLATLRSTLSKFLQDSDHFESLALGKFGNSGEGRWLGCRIFF